MGEGEDEEDGRGGGEVDLGCGLGEVSFDVYGRGRRRGEVDGYQESIYQGSGLR